MNGHLLSCLFSETPSPNPVPAPSTTIMSQRRDYGYLRPAVLSSECTRRELVKFSEACQIWLEKSLSAEDRADTRLVWPSIRSMLDEQWTAVLSRNNIANKQFDEIYKIMDRIYLEKNPLIVQRLNARRIHKQKEETVSDCLRRIYDAYQSAELKDCPLETLSLLHLVTELPSDALSDKIKTYLVEKMRIQPNISSLEEVTTYILSIEADDVAKRSTQSQASNRVNNVSEIEDKEPVKKKIKYKCNLCLKVHERYGCTYSCDHCGRRGHRSEGCWIQFPHLNPHAPQPPGQPPKNRREQTPAQGPQRRGRSRRRSSDRKSDRGSSFERSASEPESPAGKAGKKKRHRSNRVKVLLPPGNSQENSSTGLAGSGLFGSSGRSNFPRNQLFPEDQPAITRKVNRITRLFSEDEDDDHPALPTRVNRIKKVNPTNPETLEINAFCGVSKLFEEERDGDHLHHPGLEHYSLTHLFSGEIEDKEPGTPDKSPAAPFRNGDIIDDCLSLNHLTDTEIGNRVVEAHQGGAS